MFVRLADRAPVGLFVTEIDGTVSYANASWCEMAGISLEAAKGLDWSGALHPEDRQRVVAVWEQAVAERSEFQSQYRFLKTDGSVVWVQASGSLIEDPQTGRPCYIGSCTPITEQKQAEARMRLYEAIFSTSPDFAYVFDRQHRFIYANSSLLNTWGCDWAYAAGKTCLELGYEPWHAEMHNREIDEIVRTGGSIRGDIPFTGVNGRRIYEYIFTPVIGENGEVEAVAGTTRDVTDRKLAEEQANFLNRLAGKLAAQTGEREIIHTAVTEVGNYLGCHRCYFVECLKSEDRIIATENWVRDGAVSLAGEYPLSSFGDDEWWAQYSGGDLAVEDVNTHRLTKNRLNSYETVGVKSFAVQPFRRVGDWTAILAVTEDRTRLWTAEEMELLDNVAARVWPLVEQARSLESIRRSQQRLALIAEAGRMILEAETPSAMLPEMCETAARQLEADICITLMPAAPGSRMVTVEFASGLSEEMAGRIGGLYFSDPADCETSCDDRPLSPRCMEAAGREAKAILADEGVKGYFAHALFASDEFLGVLIFASRVRGDFNNAEIEFLGTISRYVTSAYVRERLLESLLESDRRKDLFLATLAHELRNPLAPILTGLEIMKQSKEDVAKLDQITGIIERQTGHMARLIDDLLDLSRVNTGKITLRKAPAPFAEILRSAIEAAQPLFDQYGHQLEISLPLESVMVEVDASRISQVVSNLLTNAAKYTPAGGRIRLVAARDGQGVSVKVSDNGQGIDAADLQSIFEIFHQTANGSSDGLGIGLTLVKSLVEMHGGSVTVASEGKSRGSEFRVSLPDCLIDVPTLKVTPPVAVAEKSELQAGTAKRVLVVDDGRNAADMLALFFRLQGIEVAVAYDGREGLEKANSFDPDLVIMDIGMPLMDGIEAARQMRAGNLRAVLVALSGWGGEDDKRRTKDAGFDEHLVKPVKPDDLRILIARYLA